VSALIRKADYTATAAVVRDWRTLHEHKPQELYEVARRLAELSTHETMAAGDELRKNGVTAIAWSELAVETLLNAVEIGFRDFDELKTDSAWHFLHMTPQYFSLLEWELQGMVEESP
jgi:hypothetical protein